MWDYNTEANVAELSKLEQNFAVLMQSNKQ